MAQPPPSQQSQPSQQSPNQSSNAKAQILNDRTYQEVEYLKKNLGPILVAALAEICIRRPADPIEYLGHWLLRWRYNEELKRRDVQNALEVVRQKAWTKDDESLQANPTAPDQPPAPSTFTQGFVPGAPYAPAGYGGPLDQNAVEEAVKPEGEEVPPQPADEGEEEEGEGEGVDATGTAEAARSGELPEGAERQSPAPVDGEAPPAGSVSPTAIEEPRTSSGAVAGQGSGTKQVVDTKTSPTKRGSQEKGRLSGDASKPRLSGEAAKPPRLSGEQNTRRSGDPPAMQAERRSADIPTKSSGEQQAETGEARKSQEKPPVDANNAEEEEEAQP